jgi:hypothetical protein
LFNHADAPFRPGLTADARMGRINYWKETPFSDEDRVFCDKPSDLPDFCRKWGGRHHKKAEAPWLRIGCPHPCKTPDRLCRLFIFTEGITIADERTRWMFGIHKRNFSAIQRGMYDETPDLFGD